MRVARYRRLLATVGMLGLLLAIAVAAEAPKPTLSRMPYVQFSTHDAITVVWRTRLKTTPVVRIGTSPGALDKEFAGDAVTVRLSPDLKEDEKLPRLHSAPKGSYQYEARITGLAPDTTYFYGVFDGQERLAGADEEHRFVTHPVIGTAKKVCMWVVGDSGTGGKDQANVYKAMLKYTQENKQPIDMYLHVGDMAYNDGTDEQFQDRFFKIYEPTLRNVVCWPSMGNHEGGTSKGESGIGPYYDAYVVPTKGEAGGLASGSEAYYSFECGRVHFICLDSHDLDRKPAGAMAQWLRADLDRAKADWLIAFWHHPPYTKGTHDSDKESQLVEMREHIMPILEAGGVDLVLTGHSHIYERSMLIDGAYATPTVADNVILDDGDGDPAGDGAYRKSAGIHPHEGDVQIVAGHGGASQGREGTMPIMKRVFVEFGSVLVTIDGDTLTGIMVNAEGVRRDLFCIVKQGTVSPTRVASPRLLAPYTPPKKKADKEVSKQNIPKDAVELVKQGAMWHYLAAPGKPPADWFTTSFHPEGWKEGNAGFGYEDEDDATVLDDMKGKYTTVYLVKEFDVEPSERPHMKEFGVAINYDDGFVVHLNGQEVLRVGVSKPNAKGEVDVEPHETRGYRFHKIKDFEKLLRDGDNFIAIEGHNDRLDSSDFSLDPYIIYTKKP